MPDGGNPLALVLADVDNDGDLDFLVAGGSVINVCLNNGNGLFTSGTSIALSGNTYGISVGDVDGDGDLDLVFPNFNLSTVSVRLRAVSKLVYRI